MSLRYVLLMDRRLGPDISVTNVCSRFLLVYCKSAKIQPPRNVSCF